MLCVVELLSLGVIIEKAFFVDDGFDAVESQGVCRYVVFDAAFCFEFQRLLHLGP